MLTTRSRRPRRVTRAQRQRRLAIAAVSVTCAAIIALATGAIWLSGEDYGTPLREAGGEVLVVLPFKSLDADPEAAQFGVGLADSIISHLATVPGLSVRSMGAALGAIEDGSGPIEAGRKLRAVAVMTGQYRRADGRFQVTIRLLDVRTEATLWSHSLDSGVADLMEVERTVVERTLKAMLPKLRNEEWLLPADDEQRDATAHYLYLLARGKIATWQSAPVAEAVELLDQAIRLDPDYAPSHAALATASANMILGSQSADRHWLQRAVAAGRRAVYLDDRNASAHFALGHALLVSGDPVASTRETLRALQLDPGNADALRALANLVAGAGQPGPVRSLRDAARRADPMIEVGWLDVWLGMIEGSHEQKIAELEATLQGRQAAGDSPELTIMQLGYLAFECGDTASQLRFSAMLEEVSANRPYTDLLRLLALGRSGDEAGMRHLIEKNRGFYMNLWDSCDLIGRCFASMGLTEDGIAWLERSVASGNYDAGTWEHSPMLDGVRGRPRFEAALATVRERARAIVQLAEFAGYI